MTLEEYNKEHDKNLGNYDSVVKFQETEEPSNIGIFTRQVFLEHYYKAEN